MPPSSTPEDSKKPAANAATYFEFQVEKPAQRRPETGHPKRPASEGGQARVVAQFVVDTAGVPVAQTFKVLESTSEPSTLAVREALRTIRYWPAEINGRRLNQLVQEVFVF